MNNRSESHLFWRKSFFLVAALSMFILNIATVFSAPPPPVVINNMDSDGDGQISASEWLKAPKVFKRIDADEDGFVTLQEIIDFRQGKSDDKSKKQTQKIAATSGLDSTGNNKGWIDVHFHIVADAGDLEGFDLAAQEAIEVMDQSGISRIIALPPPRPRRNFDIESISHLVKKYGSRISFLGGGGTLNPMIQAAGHAPEVTKEMRYQFRQTAENIAASGAKGFGEITAHHVSLNPTHGYESVPADHPLFLILADVAAKHDLPIDLHFDPIPKDVKKPRALSSPKNPPIFKENISGLERLLAYNRKAKIVWAHAGSDPVGWFKPKLVRKMLDKHPNLYFSIRAFHKPINNPVWSPKDGVDYSWVRLFKKYPDRFVLGSDSFVVSEKYSGPARAPLIFEKKTKWQRKGINELLSVLKPGLVRKIGYENAVRIYRLDK